MMTTPIAGLVAYTHTQFIPDFEWFITHNLGMTPVIEVVLESGEVVLPLNIVYVSPNATVVTFTEPTGGTARLFGTNRFSVIEQVG